MSDDNIREQFKLLQRAKKMETMGQSNRALDLYLELHDQYTPNMCDAYERPAIILERLKRYDEAIKLCEAAIEGIQNDTLSGTIDKFEKRLESIAEKTKEETVDESSTVSYHFYLLGFYKSPFYLKIIMGLFYTLSLSLSIIFKDPFIALGLIFVLYGFKYLLDCLSMEVKERKLLFIIAFLSLALGFYAVLQWPQAFRENIIFEDTTESLEGGDQIFTPEKALPLIKDSHLKEARDYIEKERAVLESMILINDNDITLALVLYNNTSKKEGKALLENFAKKLADLVAADNNFELSSEDNLGELYDFFRLFVTASEDGAVLISKGNKNTKSNYIIWE